MRGSLTMDIIARIAEERIRKAMEEGVFDNLAGKGKPLFFDDTWVPEDLRSAYRILKNAGCIPPEAELRKEIFTLKNLIETIDDDRERCRKQRELDFKLMKLNMERERALNQRVLSEYGHRILKRLSGRTGC